MDIYIINRVNNKYFVGFGWVMAANATFNNISVVSWRSVLLVEETGVPGENYTTECCVEHTSP